VIDDPDIYRAAKLVIDQQGDDVTLRAAQRADGLLNKETYPGTAIWRRIPVADRGAARGRRKGEAVN
jgi:hypothetical protein